MCSSLSASVKIKVFHATGTYSSPDLTKVKYNVRGLSVIEKEQIIAQIRANNFKGCKGI
jgi:hypothetical protein